MSTSRTDIVSTGPEDTQRIAGDLINRLENQSVIALHGELGSGKTCFVQGIARSLGVQQPVTSPTFKIINEYTGTRPLYHIDLYRMKDAVDSHAIGIEDYIDGNGIIAIEWPDRAAALLPMSTVHIYFQTTQKPDERIVSIENAPQLSNDP